MRVIYSTIRRLCTNVMLTNSCSIKVNRCRNIQNRLFNTFKYPVLRAATAENDRNASTSLAEINLPEGLDLPNVDEYSVLATDAKSERKIKLILMEHALARMSAEFVPTNLTLADMEELLGCNTACERLDLFDFYYTRQMRRQYSKLQSKAESTTEWEKERDFLANSYEASDHIRYGLGHNTPHLYLELEWLRSFYANRLAQAAKFGQPLVFDFGYDKYMSRRESVLTATSIQQAYAENRKHAEPFDMHFSNFHPAEDMITCTTVKKQLDYSFSGDSMVTISQKNYFEMFPDKECVYLCSHADQDMQFYDHNAVYIIGSFTDNSGSRPVTLMKAKADGVKTLRVPIEKYTKNHTTFQKQLQLSSMLLILLEMKSSGQWQTAINTVGENIYEVDADYDEWRYNRNSRKKDKRFKVIAKDFW